MANPRTEREGSLAKERRIRTNRTRFVVCMALLVIIVGVITYILCTPKLYIQSIVISGTRLADDEMMRETIRAHLDQKVFGVIPRWHVYLSHDRKLKKTLSSEYPLFTDISIHSQDQTLYVDVVERDATYLWCEDSSDDTPMCAYMNTQGVLFSEAPYFSKTSRLVFYTKAHEIGEAAFTADEIQKITVYQTQLKTLGFIAHEVRRNDLYVHIVGTFVDNPAMQSTVMVDPDEDPLKTISYIQVLLQDTDFIKAFRVKPLQYIDARFGKVMYYRFD